MLNGTLSKILLVIVVLIMVSCEPSPDGKKISGTQDYSGTQFPITVYTYDNTKDLNKAIKKKKSHKRKVEGFSLWVLSKKSGEMTRCEIHVVVPRNVADEHMTTWGHELAHCVYGTYHKEPK